ncbi:MAG: C40 family peptidase, partial [Lachnospiraceae bacterium]|nr:C40 family peptidase [Lachnospiraceae bacterium]
VVEPVCATTISDLEKEKQELEEQKKEAENKQSEEQEKLNTISGEIDTMQGEADDVAGEIEEIDAALVETIASVEIIEEDIGEKETQIEETTVEYEAALATEQEQYESMKLRVKFMYEKGETTYLQLFLESQSLSDMVNKADYFEKLYAYDRKMLEEYQLARETTQTLKEQLEGEMAELEAQQHELEEEKASLETMLTEKQAAYEDYELMLAKAKQEAAVYKANVEKQTAEIRRLEQAAAKKESEIEAAKKAEEEAKKAQEEALKKQKSSSGSGSSGSSSSSAGSGYASAASYAGSGSKGQQVANYACQFIGNPYVMGGTSLTNGADCSGFVFRVYKDFGYSLPRTSYAQRSAGTEVSYSDAQPGDVICYAGHVGIYIGNGQIVHASTQKTGIKVTRATYREILSVRRIV